MFSAILTAFNVQSYQLLQPASTDQTNAILARVSAQLASFSNNPSFINSTQPAFDATPQIPFTAPVYAIWMNALWFTSLIFSLAAGTVGIIVKQWLKEYNTGLYGTSRDIMRRRQNRLNNLEKWRVSVIVAVIPVLLLIALILFLAGLLILIYTVHPIVAAIASVFAAILLIFIAITTILPSFYSTCCYYSPQAHAVFLIQWSLSYRLFVFAKRTFRWIILRIISGICKLLFRAAGHCCFSFSRRLQVSDSDEQLRDIVVRRLMDAAVQGSRLRWLANLDHNLSQPTHVQKPVWKEGERISRETARHLDADALVAAYSETLDLKALDIANSIVGSSQSDHELGFDYITLLVKQLDNPRLRPDGDSEWPDAVHATRNSIVQQLLGTSWTSSKTWQSFIDAMRKHSARAKDANWKLSKDTLFALHVLDSFDRRQNATNALDGNLPPYPLVGSTESLLLRTYTIWPLGLIAVAHVECVKVTALVAHRLRDVVRDFNRGGPPAEPPQTFAQELSLSGNYLGALDDNFWLWGTRREKSVVYNILPFVEHALQSARLILEARLERLDQVDRNNIGPLLDPWAEVVDHVWYIIAGLGGDKKRNVVAPVLLVNVMAEMTIKMASKLQQVEESGSSSATDRPSLHHDGSRDERRGASRDVPPATTLTIYTARLRSIQRRLHKIHESLGLSLPPSLAAPLSFAAPPSYLARHDNRDGTSS